VGNNHTGKSRNSDNWRTVIDGWVRDPAIRQYSLIVLGMLLVGVMLPLGLASGLLLTALDAVLPTLLAKTLTAGALGTAGSLGWWWHRRRRRPER
jgi:hypothetical protein